MKKLIFLLLLLPVFANAQFVNDFTGQNVILPSDTSKLNHSYYTKHGQIMYMGSTLFVNNGTTWSAIGATNYYAGFGLGLHIDTFYVDTSKIVTRLSLGDSLGLYATKVAVNDTAASIRTQNATFATHTALVDTAAAIRASSSSTAGLATTVALTDTAAALRTYAQTNLNDTAIAIRSVIPSTAGLATTVALTDTAIARAATAQTNLVDTAAAIRGSFPSTAGLATTVALTDTAIARALTAKTNLDDTASTLRGWANGKFSTITGTVTSVGLAAGTGINVSGSPVTSSGVMTVTATGSLTAGTGINVYGSFPTYTVTNSSPSSGGTVTSIQVVSNAAAYSVTPTSAITSSGAFSIIPTGTSGQYVKGDGTLGTSVSGTVTSVGLSGGTGITIGGSPITGSGVMTVTATGSITAGTNVTVSGTFPIVTINATSSGGTVTSVGLIGSTTLSVTGTASPITGAGTYSLSVPASVPLAGSPTTTTQSAGTNNTTIATTAFVNTVVATTSVNATPLVPGGNITLSAVGSIVAGSNISTTTSGSTVTVNALPTTGTSQIQYNKSGNFASASKSLIDSADGTNIFICQTFTTIPTNGNPGMLKIIADSLYGYEQLMTISGTTGLATPLQTSNVHHYDGRMYSNGGAVLADGFYNSAISNSGTPSFVLRTYDASNCAPNFLSIKTSTSASPNSSTEWWYGFSGRDGMITSSIFTGGSVLVMDFHLAAYFSTQRAFFGYTSTSTQMTTTGDPSGVLNIVGAGKDAADATLQIMFNNGSGTATKVNTGITPTVNDRYRVTVWLPSNTTTEYVTVEKFTTTTYTIVGASNTGKIPTAGTLMYLHMMVNTGAASTISSLNIHWIKEEQYEY